VQAPLQQASPAAHYRTGSATWQVTTKGVTHSTPALPTVTGVILEIGAGSIATGFTRCALQQRESATKHSRVNEMAHRVPTGAAVAWVVIQVGAGSVATGRPCCAL
jgi:hypothetical protein